MIHLRVRTEYSFRETFAPLPRVIARLQAVGATAAGMVDLGGGTWGHVRWDAAMRRAGLSPLFGAEFVVTPGHPPADTRNAPTAWALAEDSAALYALASLAAQQPSGFNQKPGLTQRQFLDAPGLMKFAGSALARSEEAVVDARVYLDLNPAAVLTTRDALATARRCGAAARIVLTADNYYAAPEDRKLHELVGRSNKTSPQHLLDEGELIAAFADQLGSRAAVDAALANAAEIAARLAGVKLRRAPLIKLEGDVEALCREGQAKRLALGQIKEWTPEYEARLQKELTLVKEKAFDSYFLMVADMMHWAKQRMLAGPGRGSSAGSLMCYLLAITEVDPLPFGLLFERFVDQTRGGHMFNQKFVEAINALSSRNTADA